MSTATKLQDIIRILEEYKNRKHEATGEYDTPSITIFSDWSGHISLGDIEETEAGFLGDLNDALRAAKEIAVVNDRVDLNGSYSAEVSKDGIEVGCQKISFEAFDKLAEVVSRVRKESGNKVGAIVTLPEMNVGERAMYIGTSKTSNPYSKKIWTKVGDQLIKDGNDGRVSTYDYRDTFWKIVE